MREVKRLIMEIAHAGRTEGRMLADAEKRAIREVVEGCAGQMGTLSQRKFISERAGVLDTVRGALRKGLSSIISMRFLARWMDGFAQDGVNQKAWFMPLQKALSEELALKREMDAGPRRIDGRENGFSCPLSKPIGCAPGRIFSGTSPGGGEMSGRQEEKLDHRGMLIRPVLKGCTAEDSHRT